jgi:hypothetical protein
MWYFNILHTDTKRVAYVVLYKTMYVILNCDTLCKRGSKLLIVFGTYVIFFAKRMNTPRFRLYSNWVHQFLVQKTIRFSIWTLKTAFHVWQNILFSVLVEWLHCVNILFQSIFRFVLVSIFTSSCGLLKAQRMVAGAKGCKREERKNSTYGCRLKWLKKSAFIFTLFWK